MLECRPMTDREREEYLTWLRSWLAQTREEPPEEMADFFSRRVDIYEDRHLGRWGEEYAHIADCFDEKLERLLDIGCGTGLELASLYRRFPALQVTGIDLSETMLGPAAGLLSGPGPPADPGRLHRLGPGRAGV